MKKINTPLQDKQIKNLNVGEELLLSGTLYTARDQAHKRLTLEIKKGKKLSFDLKGQIIYYCGPTRTPKEKSSAPADQPPVPGWMRLLRYYLSEA